MKKYMDKFKRSIHINKNLFIFLLIIVLIGITAGAIFSSILSTDDKLLVSNYLNNFFDHLNDNKIQYNESLINTLIFTIVFAILIWLLGVSVIGFFIVIFLLFLKSFILGFSIGSIILNLKFKGVLYSFVYVFPHQVINILIFMLLSAYALIVSFKIIRCFKGKKTLDFKNIINRYITVLIFSIIVLICTGLYEVYLMPRFLNIIINILK